MTELREKIPKTITTSVRADIRDIATIAKSLKALGYSLTNKSEIIANGLRFAALELSKKSTSPRFLLTPEAIAYLSREGITNVTLSMNPKGKMYAQVKKEDLTLEDIQSRAEELRRGLEE